MSLDALLPYLSFTPSGILGIVAMMLFLGHIVPARQVDRLTAVLTQVNEAQAVTISELKSALEAERSTNHRLVVNNDALLRGNTTTVQVLGSLPEVVGNEGGGNVQSG